MESRILAKDRLTELVDALIEDYEVIAPRDEQSYGEIATAGEWRQAAAKPAQSLKTFFLPERELLLRYALGRSGIELVEPPSPRTTTRVIVGARPCDAAALPILDLSSSGMRRIRSTLSGERPRRSSLWRAMNRVARASVSRSADHRRRRRDLTCF